MIKTALFMFPLILPLALADNLIADPGFELPGAYHIIPPWPYGVVGANTDIHVLLQNNGNAPTAYALVMLEANECWGVTYAGWKIIGFKSYSLHPMSIGWDTFTYVFTKPAQICLRATVVFPGNGGNKKTSNDIVQYNWNGVRASKKTGYDLWIPFINCADEDIAFGTPRILCLRGTAMVDCTEGNDNFGQPEFVRDDAQPRSLGPQQVHTAFVHIPNNFEDGMIIVVQAEMNGELNDVTIQIVASEVEDILNLPEICDGSHENLEEMLAEALTAYKEQEYKRAIEILSDFVKHENMEACDLWEECDCLNKLFIEIVDAGIMIARECLLAKIRNPTKNDLDIYLGDIFDFRRGGFYAASLLKAAEICA